MQPTSKTQNINSGLDKYEEKLIKLKRKKKTLENSHKDKHTSYVNYRKERLKFITNLRRCATFEEPHILKGIQKLEEKMRHHRNASINQIKQIMDVCEEIEFYEGRYNLKRENYKLTNDK